MQVQKNIPLKNYSTMRLGGPATALATVHSKDELLAALDWAMAQHLPVLMLGEGSNIIVQDTGFAGLVIIDRIDGFAVLQDTTDFATIRVGAGEHWDTVVARTVKMGVSGIEPLSLIPGTAGATPVQNVGAYGAEIADTLVELEAYDLQTKRFITLSKTDCQFSYRNSRFKSLENRRYIITNITLKLGKHKPQPPFYQSLQRYFDEHHIVDYTPLAIRQAVITLRTRTLPDPKIIANTGSFFKNPIVPRPKLEELQINHPDMPFYDMPDGRVKLLAGWLIDQAGLKGYHAHGLKVYEHNALVFVNESAHSYSDLALFKEEVVQKVHHTFGVTLQQEPELI